MIDPSIFTSDIHVTILARSSYSPIFVSSTLAYLLEELRNGEVEEREVVKVLRYFVFPPWVRNKITLSRHWHELKQRIVPYEARKEHQAHAMTKLEDRFPRLPQTVLRILAEEYSFMVKGSSLLLKSKQPLNYMRAILLAMLDASNKLKDRKEEIFNQIRGPRWIVAVLLEAGAIKIEDPILASVLASGGFILVFFDP